MEMKTKRVRVERFVEKIVNEKGNIFVVKQLGIEREIIKKTNKIEKSMLGFNPIIWNLDDEDYAKLAIRVKEEIINSAIKIAKKRGSEFVVKALQNEEIIQKEM